MPRVHHVKKARKERPQCGVKIGDSYYHWSFRLGYGSTERCSKTYPRASQLTMSDFWIEAHTLTETLEDSEPYESSEDLEAAKEGLLEGIDDLAATTQDKLDAMPDGLREGPTGEMLQERVDACEDWKNDIEGIDIPEADDFEDQADFLQALADASTEMAGTAPSCD